MAASATRIHIVLDKGGRPWVDGTNVKVIEIVLDHVANGWTADAIHENHRTSL